MSKQDKALQHAIYRFQRMGNLTFQPVSPRLCRGLMWFRDLERRSIPKTPGRAGGYLRIPLLHRLSLQSQRQRKKIAAMNVP
jgi:hypothetical protein